MSNGKLKASTNRVRTSIALQANNMWTKTIGLDRDPQAGSNSAVEASLNAPTHGGGRAARRAAAHEAVLATGGFDTAVSSYESLLTLARNQGAVGGQNRGACKVCGQLGHLTKQCYNQFSVFYDSGSKAGPSGQVVLPVVPEIGSESEISDSDSESDTSSSSESETESERRKRKEKEKKRKRKEHGSKEKKHKHKDGKKEKSSHHHKEKHRKDKKAKRDK